MKRTSWKVYAFWIILAEAVGAFAAFLTRAGTDLYNASAVKPPLSPPPVVFPVVWAVLYLLMGIGAARVALAPESDRRGTALKVFLLQLTFNFCWSLIFFNLRAYAVSLAWIAILFALVLWMIAAFRRVDRVAGSLQIPYALWVAFAAYLFAGVYFLNR